MVGTTAVADQPSISANRLSGVIPLGGYFDPYGLGGTMAVDTEYVGSDRHRATFCVGTRIKRTVQVRISYTTSGLPGENVRYEPLEANPAEPVCRTVNYQGQVDDVRIDPGGPEAWHHFRRPYDGYKPKSGQCVTVPSSVVDTCLKQQARGR